MHILFADDTNKEPSADAKFFVYGCLVFPIDKLSELDSEIAKIRKEHGYSPNDQLKFQTRATPTNGTEQDAKIAKQKVVQLCYDLNAKLIIYTIHHALLKSRTPSEKIHWSVDHVLWAFNRFLEESGSHGLCVFDNLSTKDQWQYFREKFTIGLNYAGKIQKLNNIKLYAASTDNAAHAISAIDIVLGCFRYCINNPKNEELSLELMQNIVQLMWYTSEENGVRNIAEK